MRNKKAGIIWVLIFLIIFVILIFIGFLVYLLLNPKIGSEVKTSAASIINPMEKIKTKSIINSTNSSNIANSSNIYNETQVIEEGIKEFDKAYIDYILYALGVDKLHSALGFGNPIVLIVVDGEEWSSEIVNGMPNSIKQGNENADIKVVISKDEAVKSLLAEDIKSFMKDSVIKGNTQIEMIAGNPELFAKGYLSMYNSLTGNMIKISW